MTNAKVKAPWNDHEIVALNTYQRAGYFHPYTCGRTTCDGVLRATREGWVCSSGQCHYRQDWCHAWTITVGIGAIGHSDVR